MRLSIGHPGFHGQESMCTLQFFLDQQPWKWRLIRSDFLPFFLILFSKKKKKTQKKRTLKRRKKKYLKKLTNKIFQLVHETVSHTGTMFVRQLTPVGAFWQCRNVDVTKESLNRMKNTNTTSVQQTEGCFLSKKTRMINFIYWYILLHFLFKWLILLQSCLLHSFGTCS